MEEEHAVALNAVVTQCAVILELLAAVGQPLLLRREPDEKLHERFVLDLCLHAVDGVGRLNLQGGGLHETHKDLHDDEAVGEERGVVGCWG